MQNRGGEGGGEEEEKKKKTHARTDEIHHRVGALILQLWQPFDKSKLSPRAFDSLASFPPVQ